MSVKLLRALADDCRDAGDMDIAEGIEGIISDIAELCSAIKAERAAQSSGDTLAYLEARLRTTSTLVKFDSTKVIDHA